MAGNIHGRRLRSSGQSTQVGRSGARAGGRVGGSRIRGATASTSEGQELGWSRDLATGAAFRTLTILGLDPEEAANLTAFMVGIHGSDQQWDLGEVNRLLFLRARGGRGSFAGMDDRASVSSDALS